MGNAPLKTIAEFCRDNRFSKATFYNLEAIGRAPATIRIGSRVLISTESEAAWRDSMASDPVVGGVRQAAEAARAQSVAA